MKVWIVCTEFVDDEWTDPEFDVDSVWTSEPAAENRRAMIGRYMHPHVLEADLDPRDAA